MSIAQLSQSYQDKSFPYWSDAKKVDFIQHLLPDYSVTVHRRNRSAESQRSVRCISNSGMSDEQWEDFKVAVKEKFSVIEFFANTNYRHKDFIIFFR